MRRDQFAGVLDGAPILLRACGDLAHVRKEAIGVGAVAAVQLFEGIEVREALTIEDDVILTPDLGDAVHGKADRMVDADAEIEQQHGNDERIDDRRCNDHHGPRTVDVVAQSDLHRAMALQHLLFEDHLVVLDAEAELGADALEGAVEIAFELAYLR